ncbi:MAG: ComF family protein [Kineosporiaceae bacterium]
MRRSRPGPPTWWAALAGLALPVACPGCGAPGQRLCPACRSALTPTVLRVSLTAAAWLPAHAGGRYEGVLASTLLAWKDRGRADLTSVLAPALACAVAARCHDLAAASRLEPADVLGAVSLVPVPSSRAATRARGEDVVLGLARTAAGLLSAPSGPRPRVVPALRQRRGVADQAGLGRTARQRNVAGAFVVRGRPPALALVVDDVLTTGASAAAAVHALHAAGTAVLGACAVSATPPPGGLSEPPDLR